MEEADDAGIDPKLALNRANNRNVDASSSDGIERTAVKTKQAPLMETFRGTKKLVADDGVWKERGLAILGYDVSD